MIGIFVSCSSWHE